MTIEINQETPTTSDAYTPGICPTRLSVSIYAHAILMYQDLQTCDVYCYDEYGSQRSRTMRCHDFDGQLGHYCEDYWQWEFATDNNYIQHASARRVGCTLNLNGDCATWNYITGKQTDVTCTDPCFVMHHETPSARECIELGDCSRDLYGCTDDRAVNYNPNATIEADSSNYPDLQCYYDTSFSTSIYNYDPNNIGHLIAVLQCPKIDTLEGCAWIDHSGVDRLGRPQDFDDFLPSNAQMTVHVDYQDPNQYIIILPGPAAPLDDLQVFLGVDSEDSCHVVNDCPDAPVSMYQSFTFVSSEQTARAALGFYRPNQITIFQEPTENVRGFVLAGDWEYTITPKITTSYSAAAAL